MKQHIEQRVEAPPSIGSRASGTKTRTAIQQKENANRAPGALWKHIMANANTAANSEPLQPNQEITRYPSPERGRAANDADGGTDRPALYETDSSRYAGPHRWQIHPLAKLIRRLWRHRAYGRWVDEAVTELTVTGREHLEALDGPCIVIANHQSHLDTLVAFEAMPESLKRRLFFGAAQDRWFVKGKKKTVLQPWYQSLILGNFPIMRGGGSRALEYAGWLLGKRQAVFLFPEGTRATSEELGRFRHGVALLAREHGVPVVPMYLSGLRALRPKGSKAVVPGPAGVEILPPMRFGAESDVAEVTDALWQAMSAVHRRHVRLEAELDRAA